MTTPHAAEPSAEDLHRTLQFLRAAESLKYHTRTSWTSTGSQETIAAHSWRLCLMAIVFASYFPGLDHGKLLRLCVVHDLGEAINGDISAVLQANLPGKADQERADLALLTAPLAESVRAELLALWDEYEQAATPEARIAKGLDKLETIMQHNQGIMPSGFDFRYNLHYGAAYTADDPVLKGVRALLDVETTQRALEADPRLRRAPDGPTDAVSA